MAQSPSPLERWLQPERIGDYLTGIVLVLVGWLIARVLARLFEGAMQQRLTTHQLIVWRRMIHHGLLALFVLAALREMGFNLSVLLGAAGVLTVAIGFASQTSASNLISGIFLIGEGSFGIGDYIRVGQTEGEVLSIDLLSVKLCTADNLFVRIPNEQIIRSEVVNYTRFPIRRLSLSFTVAWREDVARVRALLLKVVAEHPACLDEPGAQVIMQGLADEAVTLQLLVWTRRQNALVLRDQLQESIRTAFADSGVGLPPRLPLQSAAGRPPAG
ncbi:MAG: MscS Mechanosensitive ion channel [Moraxellaceae bacterium]|jgi:small-conductance mechanosensitive channel|nr:MscS Mechanosensitive ion channel [Moraxellaceae bacterium]